MSLNFLTKGLAVATSSGSKIWQAIKPAPLCTDTIESYQDEVSWVEASI